MTGRSIVVPRAALTLGLRDNLGQFSLLLLVNACVGAMVGMERTVLPALAEEEFGLTGRTAILSFIVVFGLTKAVANFIAGQLAERIGRRRLLLAGWVVATPVPWLLMWAPDWNWVLGANALLGFSQGLTWSTTVIMKIDLVGPSRRGLAMGLNECAGYLAVAGVALATGWIAARAGLRPEPFYLGVVFVLAGLGLSLLVRDTSQHVALEAAGRAHVPAVSLTPRDVFWTTTLRHRDLSSATQAGLVNNLNDGMAWGLFPLFFAGAGMTIGQIGVLAAIYPATWAVVQVATGALSDRVGRRELITSGMWVQAAAIAMVSVSDNFTAFAAGATLLGLGTAMVYPTLLAAIADAAEPAWRAAAIGTYRLWRDLGYVAGALLAGISADALGLAGAIQIVAALTFCSGVLVAVRMRGDAQAPRYAERAPS